MNNENFLLFFEWCNDRQEYLSTGSLIYDSTYRKGFVSFAYDPDYLSSNRSLTPIPQHDNNNYLLAEQANGQIPVLFKKFIPGPYAEALFARKYPDWYKFDEFTKLSLSVQHVSDFNSIQVYATHQNETPSHVGGRQLPELLKLIDEFHSNPVSTKLLESDLNAALLTSDSSTPQINYLHSDGQKYHIEYEPTDENKARSLAFTSELMKNAGINTANTQLLDVDNQTLLAVEDYHHRRTKNSSTEDTITKFHSIPFSALVQSQSDSPLLPGQVLDFATANKVARQYLHEEQSIELLKRYYFGVLVNSAAYDLAQSDVLRNSNNQWFLAPMKPQLSFDNPSLLHTTRLEKGLSSQQLHRLGHSSKSHLIDRLSFVFDTEQSKVKEATQQVSDAVANWSSAAQNFGLSESCKEGFSRSIATTSGWLNKAGKLGFSL